MDDASHQTAGMEAVTTFSGGTVLVDIETVHTDWALVCRVHGSYLVLVLV